MNSKTLRLLIPMIVVLVAANFLAFSVEQLTLPKLLIGIGVISALFTVYSKSQDLIENWMVSFVQYFAGILFVFSGFVKAADPMGTAFKMEQYFAEFESTFADTTFSFLAPIFPFFSSFAVGFSVFMIVLEIALGVALIIGWRPRLSAWIFAAIIFFFTFLTGFTYLTGHVPDGVNFFQFGQWSEWVETNMKVTDCGCFGDFLVLQPYTSFLKDLMLLVPALTFLFFTKKMHQHFSKGTRLGLVLLTSAGFLLYCFSNYMWDIPGQDFRPFRIGTDIAATKQAEMDAAANVQLLGYEMVDKASGEVAANLDVNEFLARYQEFPEDQYEYVQLKTEPEIEATKISDFELQDASGNDQTENLLDYNGYIFTVVAYKIKGEKTGAETVYDTVQIMQIDTVAVQAEELFVLDTSYITEIVESENPLYTFDDNYLHKWTDYLMPVLNDARAAGHQAIVLTAFAEDAKLRAFANAIGADGINFLRGDDIMLKTIIRSNPGVVLLQQGRVVDKYHYKKLPPFQEIVGEHGLEINQ